MSAPRWLPAAGVTLAAAAFTWFNRGERIVVDLGVLRLYRAPLPVVVFLAFLAGMLAMMALSLRHDRRVREELRRRGLLDIPPPAEPVRPVSAWGVAREPARADDRTVVMQPREEDRTVVSPREDDRTAQYRHLDEDPAL